MMEPYTFFRNSHWDDFDLLHREGVICKIYYKEYEGTILDKKEVNLFLDTFNKASRFDKVLVCRCDSCKNSDEETVGKYKYNETLLNWVLVFDSPERWVDHLLNVYWGEANPNVKANIKTVRDSCVILEWTSKKMAEKPWIDRLHIAGKPLKRRYMRENPYKKYVVNLAYTLLGAILGLLF